MCGIAGAYGRIRPTERDVVLTQAALRNRGPDANGVWRGRQGQNQVTLVHTRLAIIDLDPHANQPMERDGCILVFNGEIYNYIEIRRELIAAGYAFGTDSDTEVLLVAYLHWGACCVDRLKGMWAFAISDSRENSLLLSRDVFGEKPLFYMVEDETLYFASGVKALAALSGMQPQVNFNHLKRFLVNGFRPLFKGEETFFDRIYELPAATNAVIRSPSDIVLSNYWCPVFKPTSIGLSDTVEEVKRLLVEALKIRLRSDVPVAFCLSGGVDSTTLAGIAANELGQKLHAFSIYDNDSRYDESANVETVVNSLQCNHHITHTSTKGFFDRLAQLTDYHDAPVPTISWYIHSFLSEAIHENGYKVSISGTGADEIFTGYYDHYAFWLAGRYGADNFDDLVRDWRQSYGAWVNNPLLQDPLAFVKNANARGHIYQNREIFNGFLVDPIEEDFYEEEYTYELLRNRMLNELRHEVVPVILRADDSNSMRWSVENRSPYLDRDLVDFLLSVPSEHLIHDGYPKYLLRSAASGHVPNSVRLDKRKRGFNAPINSLIDRSDSETRERLLEDSPVFDLVRRDAVKAFLDHDLDDNSFSKFMFSFISSKLFLESALGKGSLNP